MNCALLWCLLLLSADGHLAALIEERANLMLQRRDQQVKVVELRAPQDLPRILTREKAQIEFLPGETFSARSSVRLRLGNRSHWITVQFQRLILSLVATRRLERGRLVEPGDFVEKAVPLAQLGGERPLKEEQVLNHHLLAPLEPGQAVRAEWLARPVLVKRGERVLVRVRTENLLLQASGQALVDGRSGDVIAVANEASGKRLAARVISAGLVEADELSGRKP